MFVMMVGRYSFRLINVQFSNENWLIIDSVIQFAIRGNITNLGLKYIC